MPIIHCYGRIKSWFFNFGFHDYRSYFFHSWHGKSVFDAAIFRDYPTLQGCFFFIALLVILGNILTDVICILVDPRQRFGVNNET